MDSDPGDSHLVDFLFDQRESPVFGGSLFYARCAMRACGIAPTRREHSPAGHSPECIGIALLCTLDKLNVLISR